MPTDDDGLRDVQAAIAFWEDIHLHVKGAALHGPHGINTLCIGAKVQLSWKIGDNSIDAGEYIVTALNPVAFTVSLTGVEVKSAKEGT